MVKIPILIVRDAGFGATPIPADSVLKPGDEIIATHPETGEKRDGKCVGVAPVGVPIEYAMADQSEPPEPRPLAITVPTHNETIYAIEWDDGEVQKYRHSQLAQGRKAAVAAGLG